MRVATVSSAQVQMRTITSFGADWLHTKLMMVLSLHELRSQRTDLTIAKPASTKHSSEARRHRIMSPNLNLLQSRLSGCRGVETGGRYEDGTAESAPLA